MSGLLKITAEKCIGIIPPGTPVVKQKEKGEENQTVSFVSDSSKVWSSICMKRPGKHSDCIMGRVDAFLLGLKYCLVELKMCV